MHSERQRVRSYRLDQDACRFESSNPKRIGTESQNITVDRALSGRRGLVRWIS
jgi:hypothetical protein